MTSTRNSNNLCCEDAVECASRRSGRRTAASSQLGVAASLNEAQDEKASGNECHVDLER